jgi:hypothetical protein
MQGHWLYYTLKIHIAWPAVPKVYNVAVVGAEGNKSAVSKNYGFNTPNIRIATEKKRLLPREQQYCKKG